MNRKISFLKGSLGALLIAYIPWEPVCCYSQSSVPDTVVKMTTALDNTFLCPGKGEVYYYVDLQACALGKKVPLNISVVFDRSGSMDGDRIKYGKLAVEYLIDHLSSEDKMSLVMYDHESEVIHGSEAVTNKDALKKKVHHMTPRGHTNISAGLQKGFEEVRSTFDSSYINKIFLLTDGLANEGITDDYILEQIVKGYSSKYHIATSTFGLGEDFNEVLLHDMAEAGSGSYYFIEQPSDAQRDFGQEIKTLLSVVGQNTKLLVDFPADVFEVATVYGQHYTTYGSSIYIDLKEIHPSEHEGLLIKFKLKTSLTKPASFKSTLIYNNAVNGTKTTVQKENVLNPSNNLSDCDSHMNNDVLEKVITYSSNHLLESAIKDAENDDLVSAKDKVKQSKNLLSQSTSKSVLVKDQMDTLNLYEEHLAKYNQKSEKEISLFHKKIRHRNYQIRKAKKMTASNLCPKL